MSFVLDGYWPWWMGATFFLVLVGGMWLIEKRLLGVSGIVTRALTKETEADKAFREASHSNPSAIEDAMLQATLEEFGQEAVDEFLREMAEHQDDDVGHEPAASIVPLPRGVNLVFLGMLVVGGFLGAQLTDSWEIRDTLGFVHSALLHGEPMTYVALVIGGVFVGFGTRMSGGCTSGHGLSGCSRLEPASILATCSFFGTAVAVSYLLRALV